MADVNDPLSSLFGAVQARGERLGFDLALGGIRGIAQLGQNLLDGLTVDSVLEHTGHYPSTQGNEDLLACFSELCASEWGIAVDSHLFVATNGALDGLAHAIRGSGAERVVYPAPGFDVSIAARRVGVPSSVVLWPVGASIAELIGCIEQRLLADSKRCCLVLNFPTNPHGETPTDDEWRALFRVAQQHSATIVLDNVYRFLAGPALLPMDDHDVLFVDSVSKRLGLPGLRLGFVLATKAKLVAVRSAASMTSVGISTAVAAIGTHALRKYLSSVDLAASVRSVIGARRESIRNSIDDEHMCRLVLGRSGLYGSIVCDSDLQEKRLLEHLARRDVFLAAGSTMRHPDHMTAPFVRFCVGSAYDAVSVGNELNTSLNEVVNG